MSPEMSPKRITRKKMTGSPFVVSVKILGKDLDDLLKSNHLYKLEVSLAQNPKTKDPWSPGMEWIICFAAKIAPPGNAVQTELHLIVLKWLLGGVLLDYLRAKTPTMEEREGDRQWVAGLSVIEQYLDMRFNLRKASVESVLSALQNKKYVIEMYKISDRRSSAIAKIASDTTRSGYFNTYRPKGVELLADAFYSAFHRVDTTEYFTNVMGRLNSSIASNIDSWVALQELINTPDSSSSTVTKLISPPAADIEQNTIDRQLLSRDNAYNRLSAQISSQEALLKLIIERLPSVEAKRQLQEQQMPSKDFLRKLLEANFPSAEVMQKLIKERLPVQKSVSNKEEVLSQELSIQKMLDKWRQTKQNLKPEERAEVYRQETLDAFWDAPGMPREKRLIELYQAGALGVAALFCYWIWPYIASAQFWQTTWGIVISVIIGVGALTLLAVKKKKGNR